MEQDYMLFCQFIIQDCLFSDLKLIQIYEIFTQLNQIAFESLLSSLNWT